MIVIEKLSHKRKKPSSKVKIVLLGLTPGKQQHETINKAKNPRDGSFKGYMRKQIFEWFKELEIARNLGLQDEDSLFIEDMFKDSLYISSLLREPVYIEKNGTKKNYSGRSPLPWKDDSLKKLMDETLKILGTIKKPVLIVPMGQIVSDAIKDFSDLDEKHFILHGFPHPSGANANRKKEFSNNKSELKRIANKFFKEVKL